MQNTYQNSKCRYRYISAYRQYYRISDYSPGLPLNSNACCIAHVRFHGFGALKQFVKLYAGAKLQTLSKLSGASSSVAQEQNKNKTDQCTLTRYFIRRKSRMRINSTPDVKSTKNIYQRKSILKILFEKF